MLGDRNRYPAQNMDCLTELETSDWLRTNCVTANTYDSSERPRWYVQFRAPRVDAAHVAIANLLREMSPGNAGVLIHVTDWSLYTPEQMLKFDSMRPSIETRPLIESAGHRFATNEQEDAVNLFAMATEFGWSSYLYLPDDVATLYNWEGDLFDFWSRDKFRLTAIIKIVGELELEITHAG